MKLVAINDTNSFLFFSAGQFLYIGKGINTQIHDHHAIQIAISFGEAIEILLPNSSLTSKAVIIDSDQPHKCKTGNNTFMLLNIAPESKVGRALKKKYFLTQKIFELPFEKIFPFINELKRELKITDKSDIFYFTQKLLTSLITIEEIGNVDERIVKTLQLIDLQIDVPHQINDLANNVFISSSRLIHLFTEQVGIPIRKYILWTKLLVAVKALINTTNITQAALEGGFSDAPHFNKTFKRMFGHIPSALLKNSQIIQVLSD